MKVNFGVALINWALLICLSRTQYINVGEDIAIQLVQSNKFQQVVLCRRPVLSKGHLSIEVYSAEFGKYN
jgi:hypothetical protein